MVDDVTDVDGITIEAASIVGRATGGPILEVLMRDNHGQERTYQLQFIGMARIVCLVAQAFIAGLAYGHGRTDLALFAAVLAVATLLTIWAQDYRKLSQLMYPKSTEDAEIVSGGARRA